jgi:nitroreductase
MDAIQVLKTRRCIRAYTSQPIAKETLADLVDCGRLAATAINIQPWEFVAVTGREDLRRITDATDHGKMIADAAACIVVLSRDTKYYLEDGSAATLQKLNSQGPPQE